MEKTIYFSTHNPPGSSPLQLAPSAISKLLPVREKHVLVYASPWRKKGRGSLHENMKAGFRVFACLCVCVRLSRFMFHPRAAANHSRPAVTEVQFTLKKKKCFPTYEFLNVMNVNWASAPRGLLFEPTHYFSQNQLICQGKGLMNENNIISFTYEIGIAWPIVLSITFLW